MPNHREDPRLLFPIGGTGGPVVQSGHKRLLTDDADAGGCLRQVGTGHPDPRLAERFGVVSPGCRLIGRPVAILGRGRWHDQYAENLGWWLDQSVPSGWRPSV